MPENIMKQQQAFIIARDYNFIPDDPLKCEQVVHETDLRSLFFANTSNLVKIYFQYNLDELEPHA